MLNDSLLKEIKTEKKSATYLFYGEDRVKTFETAFYFIKELYKFNIKDKTKIDNLLQRIENYSYSDFYIYENLNIEDVRTIKQLVYTSAFEENIKVFLIKDVKNLRKEVSNALLKILEEPTDNTFFILLSNDLNILTTIKSRSIIFKVNRDNFKDLEVDEKIYNFFLGNSQDIKAYKNSYLDLNYSISYKDIYTLVKNYEEHFYDSLEYIEDKIKIYLALIDFTKNSNNLTTAEKISFAEQIFFASIEKDTLELVISYLLHLIKDKYILKEKLELKKMLKSSVNYKNLLINLIIDI